MKVKGTNTYIGADNKQEPVRKDIELDIIGFDNLNLTGKNIDEFYVALYFNNAEDVVTTGEVGELADYKFNNVSAFYNGYADGPDHIREIEIRLEDTDNYYNRNIITAKVSTMNGATEEFVNQLWNELDSIVEAETGSNIDDNLGAEKEKADQRRAQAEEDELKITGEYPQDVIDEAQKIFDTCKLEGADIHIDNDGVSVLVKDTVNNIGFWFDIFPSKEGDLEGDWNKYIFNNNFQDQVENALQNNGRFFEAVFEVAENYAMEKDAIVWNDETNKYEFKTESKKTNKKGIGRYLKEDFYDGDGDYDEADWEEEAMGEEREDVEEYIISFEPGELYDQYHGEFITEDKDEADDLFEDIKEEHKLDQVSQYERKVWEWDRVNEEYYETDVEVYFNAGDELEYYDESKKVVKKQHITEEDAEILNDWLDTSSQVGVYKCNGKLELYCISPRTGTPEPIYNGTADYVIDIKDYINEMTYYINDENERIKTILDYVNDEIDSNEADVEEENKLTETENKDDDKETAEQFDKDLDGIKETLKEIVSILKDEKGTKKEEDLSVEEENKLAGEIEKYLTDNQLYPTDVFAADTRVMVEIKWGDWKHEHLRCDDLMKAKGYSLVEEEVTEEDGSDCYSAIRHYEPSGKFDNIEEAKEHFNKDELSSVRDSIKKALDGLQLTSQGTTGDYEDRALRDDLRNVGNFLDRYLVRIGESKKVTEAKPEEADKEIWEKVEKIVDAADNELGPDQSNEYEYDEHIKFVIYRDFEYEDIFVVYVYLDGEEQDREDLRTAEDIHLEDLDATMVDIIKKLTNKDVKTEAVDNEDVLVVNVYQIQDVENCEYAFMNYEVAKSKGGPDLKDYKKVAEFGITKALQDRDVETILDMAFTYGNIKDDYFKYNPGARSISVSDILEYNGEKYYVDTTGFEKLDKDIKTESRYTVYDYADGDTMQDEEEKGLEPSQFTIYDNEADDFYYDEDGDNPVFDSEEDAEEYIKKNLTENFDTADAKIDYFMTSTRDGSLSVKLQNFNKYYTVYDVGHNTYKIYKFFYNQYNNAEEYDKIVKEVERIKNKNKKTEATVNKFQTLTLDKNGNEMLLKDTSYNHACSWLEKELAKTGSKVVDTETKGNKTIIKADNKTKFEYDEEKGTLKRLEEAKINADALKISVAKKLADDMIKAMGNDVTGMDKETYYKNTLVKLNDPKYIDSEIKNYECDNSNRSTTMVKDLNDLKKALTEAIDPEAVKEKVEKAKADIGLKQAEETVDTEKELTDGIKKEIIQYAKQQGLDVEKLQKQGQLNSVAEALDNIVGEMVSKSANEFMDTTGKNIEWDFEVKDNNINVIWNEV